MNRLLLAGLILSLAAPACAQSLYLEKGETAPFVAAGWFTQDEWTGVVGGVGLALKGEADFILQYSRQERVGGRVVKTWTPGVRLHMTRPTEEEPVGLALEAGLLLGTNSRVDWDSFNLRETTYEWDFNGVSLMGRLTLVPPDWERDGFLYIQAGVQTIEEEDSYPLGFGVAHRLGSSLVADVSLTVVSDTEQFLVSAGWIF